MNYDLPVWDTVFGLCELDIVSKPCFLILKFVYSGKKYYKDIRISLNELYKRVKKTCKEYKPCQRTFRRAFKKLVKAGLIELVYELGFGEYVIRVKPLREHFGQTEQPETEESEPQKPEPPNNKKNEKTADKQQQHIDWRTLTETKKICMDAGLHYRLEKDIREIASHGREKLMATIRLYLKRASNLRNKIVNPCGWFRKALKDNYYLDEPIETESIPMYERMYFQAQEKLIELTGCLPKKITEEVRYAPT